MDCILGGHTSRLQVIDVGVNKSFKHNVEIFYENFMIASPKNRRVRRESHGHPFKTYCESLPSNLRLPDTLYYLSILQVHWYYNITLVKPHPGFLSFDLLWSLSSCLHSHFDITSSFQSYKFIQILPVHLSFEISIDCLFNINLLTS